MFIKKRKADDAGISLRGRYLNAARRKNAKKALTNIVKFSKLFAINAKSA